MCRILSTRLQQDTFVSKFDRILSNSNITY